MSIRHIRQRFATQLRIIFLILIPVMAFGIVMIFVPGGGMGGGRRQGPQAGSTSVAAIVNGKDMTRGEVNRSFDREVSQVLPFYAAMGQGIGVGQLWQLRYEAFERAVQNRLLLDEAERQGISVSKGVLKKQAQQMVDQEIAQLKSQYKGPQLEQVYARIVAPRGETPREKMTERQFVKWAMSRYLDSSSELRDDLVQQQLRQSVAAQVAASEQDLRQSYDKATVRHIVVSLHPQGKPVRTEEEAKKRVDDLFAKVKGGQDFVEVVKAESDDPDAKRNGGLMLGIGRGRMAKEWDAAVFALKPGEMSAPIKAPWGYEIVRMESITRELPADFEKNKEQLLKTFQQQREGEIWQRYTADLRQKAKVEVKDPEMLGYRALAGGKKEEALAKLEEARVEAGNEGGMTAAAVFFQIGQLLGQQKKWSEATDAYAEADSALSSEEVSAMLPGSRGEALMAMADAYEQLGKTEDAVIWYTTASEAGTTPAVHSQLVSAFQRLGKPDLVKQEQKWLADYQQEQMRRQAEREAQQKTAAQQAGASAPTQQTPAKGTAPR